MSSSETQAAAAQPEVQFSLPGEAPEGAIRLLAGRQEDVHTYWFTRYSTEPGGWTVGAGGVVSPDRRDIITREVFGDCFLHVEFRCPADVDGNPVSGGNSGVAFQGRYEIQVLNSYGKTPTKHECAAFYDQKPPRVIAAKKASEWQTFDILFRAPRFDEDGAVVEKARATVFQNGVLVQNNQEFFGPTGIQFGEFKGEAATGPVILQGDHDPVDFRNVWIVTL